MKRAWRLEKRRRMLGSDNPCCPYCGETEISCFELDHPVTEELDPDFTRAICRNCHRKLEFRRDVKGLTTNGLHKSNRKQSDPMERYLRLLAEDADSLAEVLESPTPRPQLTASALRGLSASLRRRADAQSRQTKPATATKR